MNPELIKIALENKAILDALKAQIETQQITTTAASNKSFTIGGLWKIALLAGFATLGYYVYSYHNNKKRLTN
jgi:hypothetical protein